MEEKKKRKRRTKAEMKAEYQSIINSNYFDDDIYIVESILDKIYQALSMGKRMYLS